MATPKPIFLILAVIIGLLALPQFALSEPKVCVPGKELELKVKVEKVGEKEFPDLFSAFLLSNGNTVIKLSDSVHNSRILFFDAQGKKIREHTIPVTNLVQVVRGGSIFTLRPHSRRRIRRELHPLLG